MEKYIKSYNVILDNMDLCEYRLKPISAIMYIQDAFARFCATKKLAAYDLFATNKYWIVTEFNIDFINDLPFWSEEITVSIWISEITKLKIYTDYEISYNNQTFAKGNALWFIIDKETKKPAKTDIITENFCIFNDYTLGEHKKFVLPEKNEKLAEINHVNNLSDIDFNNHVNNKSYINMAAMTVSDEFKRTHTLKHLNIRFNRETFLNDTLNCSTYKTNVENNFVQTVEKDGVSVCDILTSWDNKNNKDNIVDYNLKVKNE